MKRTPLFVATRVGIHLSLAGSIALWARGEPSSSVASAGNSSPRYSELSSSKKAQYDEKVKKYTASGDDYKRLKYEKRRAGGSLSAEDAKTYSKLKKQRKAERTKTGGQNTTQHSYAQLQAERTGSSLASPKTSAPPPPPPMPGTEASRNLQEATKAKDQHAQDLDLQMQKEQGSTAAHSSVTQGSKGQAPAAGSRDDLMKAIQDPENRKLSKTTHNLW